MGKSGIKNVLESPKDEIPKQLLEKKESKQENAPSFIKQVEKKGCHQNSFITASPEVHSQVSKKGWLVTISECMISKRTTKATVKGAYS